MDVRCRKQLEGAFVILRTERTVLERMLYKFANSFSKEKLYRSLKQTSKRLDYALRQADLHVLDKGKTELLRTSFGTVKLNAVLAGHHARERIQIGHHWSQWALTFAICSRIWCVSEFILKLLAAYSTKELGASAESERSRAHPRPGLAETGGAGSVRAETKSTHNELRSGRDRVIQKVLPSVKKAESIMKKTSASLSQGNIHSSLRVPCVGGNSDGRRKHTNPGGPEADVQRRRGAKKDRQKRHKGRNGSKLDSKIQAVSGSWSIG